MTTVTDETTAVTLAATRSEIDTSTSSITMETNNEMLLATTTSTEDNTTMSTSGEGKAQALIYPLMQLVTVMVYHSNNAIL